MLLQLAVLTAGAAGGIVVGLVSPGAGDALSPATWPVLGAVLYATFLQVELRTIPEALRDRRFLGTALLANFAVVPVVVGLAVLALPLEKAVAAGILLVLLAPCTDWFVSFARLGGGDTRLAVALTPVMLLAQAVMLPLYVWLFGDVTLTWEQARPVIVALAFVVVLPFVVAVLTQRSIQTASAPAWFAAKGTVPLLAATLFLVAASEVSRAWDARADIAVALVVFALYALAAAPFARAIGDRAGLGPLSSRTLAFNLGTRNSFVVLPIALTLPPEYALAAAVVAGQALVELVAMVGYVKWVPWLIPADRSGAKVAG